MFIFAVGKRNRFSVRHAKLIFHLQNARAFKVSLNLRSPDDEDDAVALKGVDTCGCFKTIL